MLSGIVRTLSALEKPKLYIFPCEEGPLHDGTTPRLAIKAARNMLQVWSLSSEKFERTL